jgi:hypothetical protein
VSLTRPPPAPRTSVQDLTLLEVHGEARRVFGVTVSDLLLWGPGTGDRSRGLWAHGTADTLTLSNVAANNCGVGFHLEGLGGADTGVGGAPVPQCSWRRHVLGARAAASSACLPLPLPPPPQVIDACQISMCDPQRNGTGLLLERCNYTKVRALGGRQAGRGACLARQPAGTWRALVACRQGPRPLCGDPGAACRWWAARCPTAWSGASASGAPTTWSSAAPGSS